MATLNPATEPKHIAALNAARQATLRNIASTGAFRMETLKTVTATEALTNAIAKQEAHLGTLWKARKTTMRSVIEEQRKMSQMSAMQFSESGLTGRMKSDFIVPRGASAGVKGLTEGLIRGNAAVGTWATAIRGSSESVIKWGKNTQWAGRQLMMGLTLPILAFGAVAGKLAYDLDTEFTKIAKVYDYTATSAKGLAQEQANLREQSLNTTKVMAKAYGADAKETMGIIADLAATGEKGVELQRTTAIVSKAAFLGDLKRNDAINATIALQNTFQMSNQDLSDSFAYMTTIANGTSLSMEDFVIAIPRIAGALKSLGVSNTDAIKDMGVLMTAMRSASVGAAEGANTIKSVLFRTQAATDKAKKTFEATGQSLDELVASANGDPVEVLAKIGQALNDVADTQKRIEIAKDVFGLFQGSKALAMVQALADKTGQVGEAYKINARESSTYYEAVDQATEKLQSSVSGRFKIMLASMKSSLASTGGMFLEFGIFALKMVKGLIEAFNMLPKIIKQVFMGGAIFLVIAGAALMLTGVMGNLLGQILRFGAGTVRMATGFTFSTAAMKAQALQAEAAALEMNNERSSAEMLKRAMIELAIGTARATHAQEIFDKTLIRSQAIAAHNIAKNDAAAQPVRLLSSGMYTAGPQDGQRGTPIVSNSHPAVLAEKKRVETARAATAATRSLKAAQDASNASALAAAGRINAAGAAAVRNTENTAKGMSKVQGAGMGVVGMMLLMVGGTNRWVGALGMTLLLMGSINLAAKKAAISQAFATGMQARAMATYTIGTKAAVGGLRAMTLGARAFGASLLASMGPMGLILVAAGAIAGVVMLWKKNSEEGAKNFAKLGDVAKSAAESMGLTYDETGASAEKTNKELSEQITLHGKLAKTNKDQIKVISQMGDTEAKNYVKQIGLEFYLATGDKQATDKMMESLLIAADKKNISKTITINYETVGNDVVDQLKANFDDIGSATFKRGTWEKMWQGAGDLSQAAGSAGREQGKTFAMALNQEIAKGTPEGMAKAAELAAEAGKLFEDDIAKEQKKVDEGGPLANESALLRAKERYKNFLDGMKEKAGITSETITTLDATLKAMYGYAPPNSAAGAAMDALAKSVEDANRAAGTLVTTFGDFGKAGDEFIATGGDIADTADAVAEAFTSAARTAMTTSWGNVISHAADQAAQAQQNAMDKMDATAKNSADKLEKTNDGLKKAMDKKEELWSKAWDAREAAKSKWYDVRKEALQSQIDAEQEAEKKRQAIFEAEKTRIQRLSEMFSRNVDFNMALNAGNLDEAARITDGGAAQEQVWAEEDAAAGSGNASEQRVNDIKSQMDALDKKEKAEKDALEATKQRQKEALDAEKQRLDESIKATTDAEAKKTETAKKGAEERYRKAKESLDLELASLQAFVPRNAAELKAHIADIQTVYTKHGLTLDTKSAEWASYVNRAIVSASNTAEQQLETDIKWKDIGAKAGSDLADGILGMSFKDFTSWMLTGKVPAAKPAASSNGFSEGASPSDPRRGYVTPASHQLVPHGGGHIGSPSFKSNRLGRPMTADLYNDEVPAILQKGEYVIDKSTVSKFGPDYFKAHQQGKIGMDNTGRMHNGGMAGAGKIFKTFKDALGMSMTAGAIRKSQELAQSGKIDNIPTKFKDMFSGGYSAGEAGKFGGTELNPAQLQNAAAILNVGRSMGATDRDLVVSLMTAMQESRLQNLSAGDRDSVGLFQQRPSQGWGTVEQIMNPAYASRKFFEHLLSIKDRDQMALTQEAQAVQRSGFPMAYAQWESTARAIIAGMGGTTGAVSGGWGNADAPEYAANNIVQMSAGGVSWSQNKLAGGRFMGLINALLGQGYRPSTVQGYNNRNIAGSDNKSNHAYGAAIDIDPTKNPRYGSQGGPFALPANSGQIASAFGLNWGGNYRSSKDYMHFEVLGSPSAPKVPGLKIGGTIKYDNTIANLHKGEKVLTAPLSRSLEKGINDMSTREGDTYQFNFDGATFTKDIDVERAVENVLNRRDSRVGRSRTVGNK